MNKKILMVRTQPYDANPNAYNIQAVGFGKALCRMGYDFDYITFKKRDQKEWVFYEANGCRARYIEKPRIRILRTGINFSICDEAFLNQYDLVITREYYQIMSYLISRKCRKTTLYSGPYFNLFMFKFFSPIYDALFTKKINRQIHYKFVKSALAKQFLEEKGYTDVINLGVGLDTERFDETTEILPDTQTVADFMREHPCILYVGVLTEQKNFPFLLSVYEKLLERRPDLRFVIVGKSKQTAFKKLLGKSNASFEKECLARMPQNVRDGIYRVQRIENPQLKYIYPLAKAFLLPSREEIFGMVLLESMYLGAPVVSSRNGGSVTLLSDGTAGQLVEKFDAELWRDAVLRYLDDPAYTEQVCRNAHALVRDSYNWDTLAKKMLDLALEDDAQRS